MAFRRFLVPSSVRPVLWTASQFLSQAGLRSCHAERVRLLPIFNINSQTRLFFAFSSLPTRNASCLLCTQCQSHTSQRVQRQIHAYTSAFNNTSSCSSRSVFSNQCKMFVENKNCLYNHKCIRNVSTKTEKIAPVTNVGPKKSRRKGVKEIEQPFIYVRDHAHFINMTTYAVGVETDLIRLQEALVAQDVYQIVKLPKDFTEVIMAEAKYKPNGKTREVFFFEDGAISCWNMLETEQIQIMRFVQPFTEQPYKMKLVQRESEMFPVILDKQTRLARKTIYLRDVAVEVRTAADDGWNTSDAAHKPDLKHQSELKHLQLEKFAFSNAVVQSVKLSVWESMLEEFKEDIEPSQDSNDDQLMTLDRKNLHQKLRAILQLRYDINLGSDLLDTPDVYWEREDLDLHYKKMCNHLDINKRTKVMNDKLNHCTQLLELYSSRLSDQHHVKLEWFIIILILIEVVFEIIHFAERLFIDSYSAPATPPPADINNNVPTIDQWQQLLNTLNLTAKSCDDTTRSVGRELLKPLLMAKQTPAAQTHEQSIVPDAAYVSDDENNR